MASKSGKEKLIDEEQEILQAVVLADSWNKRFRPLTTKKPRCLLPVCNAPLLDWTFESLALAGVQEVFVICRSYSEQIKEAIKNSKWSRPGLGMKIVPILTAKETYSAGDAMRDIYTRGLVTGDFILVHGDLVSNIHIDEVVKVHKERRKTNKDAIMTIVVKEAGVKHRTRSRGDSPIFVVDRDTSECLHYEPAFAYPKKKLAHIPREVLNEHKEVEIRYDLMDCGIDVCSFEVPSLFQDNFDYLDIRRDFVHGVLTSDLLMKNIHIYVEKEGYAARVQDTRSYESVRTRFPVHLLIVTSRPNPAMPTPITPCSKDILSRWTFPLVPDDNYPGGERYLYTTGSQYLSTSPTTTIARSATIGRHTLVGSSTSIGDHTTITSSVIGPNCTIGANVLIEDSYVFEGAKIEEGCEVRRSIIGSGVTVKEGSILSKGCLVGDGVVLGPRARLREFERVSVPVKRGEGEDSDEDEDEDVEEAESNDREEDKSILGADSNANVWHDKPPEDDDLESPENFLNRQYMRLGADDEHQASDAEATLSEDESVSDDDYDSHTDASVSGRSDLTSLTTLSGGAGLMAGQGSSAQRLHQSLERAFAEDHSVDNAAVELKNASHGKQRSIEQNDGAGQRAEVQRTIGRWGELINRIGGVDPVETITLLQKHCVSSPRMALFGQILAALYQTDIVEEDDIREWHGLSASKGEDLPAGETKENYRKTWIVGAHMIHQLDQQDSESDEDEDEDSE
ncbi:hypothetical protein NMY22_g17742 [Coprinellus aureogranulatus]|nr:hypothetical protein NMY22_g17742 [Coprinellus aureogranulatus]